MAFLAAGVGLALVAVGAPASAAPTKAAAPARPAALVASGPFAAAADASLLTLDLPSISPAILPQTNVDLARSLANAESGADIDAAKPGAQRTSASAATTGTTSVLDAPLNLQVNRASAPPSEANEDILLDLDLSPLLDLPVIRTTALANWVSDTECVAADTPLSYADQSLADLTLLGIAPGQSVVNLDTDDADGAADTEASTWLASIPGANDPRAVQARVITDITSANVLNNIAPDLASAIQIDVVQTPNYIVSATGHPGGASVIGADPVVDVTIGGNPVVTLDSTDETTEAALTDLVLGDLLDLSSDTGILADLLTDLGLEALIPVVAALDGAVEGALEALVPIVRLSIPVEKVVNPNGTSASVQASLLRVEVLLPNAVGGTEPLAALLNQILGALGADLSGPLLALDLGPVGASVVAPAGGITCGDNNPLRELNKHASATEVAPGGTFEYNIAVPNRGPCVVRNVTVTDVITGPPGFEVIGTEPPATSVNGGTLNFNLGDIAVNETKNITITVRVPDNAPDGATFDDVVTVAGECDGRPVTEDDRLDDIPTVRRNFTGDCSVQFSNKDASHIQVFPGETFSYYVHAFNSGAKPCTDVEIVDTLDDRVSFVSCNKSCVNAPANKVTWKIATLGGGSSAILSVVVKVDDDASGTLENVAVITPKNGKPVTVKTRGPVIGTESIPKDPAPAARRTLPKTGGLLPTGVAAGLGAGALALFALRRRSAIT
jgi:uncharacterized repeat protein (TIGR01451 family)